MKIPTSLNLVTKVDFRFTKANHTLQLKAARLPTGYDVIGLMLGAGRKEKKTLGQILRQTGTKDRRKEGWKVKTLAITAP